MKVIFHINESSRWKFLIPNVKNLLKSNEAKGAKIKVLANGPVVKDFIKDENNKDILDEISSLAQEGIVFLACRNALNSNNIKENQLGQGIDVVPAGVVELIKRQSQGYGYIKP